MAKHPNWSTIDPAFQELNYWTAQPSPANPWAGFWTKKREVTGPTFVSDSGNKSYSVTPNFNSPDRKTLITPLGYTAQYEKIRSDYDQREVEFRDYTYVVGGNSVTSRYTRQDSTTYQHNAFSVGFITGNYDASSVLRKATNKLLSNLKNQKINIAQAFAEREQTVKTVAGAAQTIAKTLFNLKKGNFSGAAKALGINPPKRGQRRFNKAFANDAANAVGDGWLSLEYGWKPLLRDVYGAAEELAQASVGSENRNSIFSRSSGSSRKDLTTVQRVVNTTSGWSGYDTTLRECKGFYAARLGVVYVRSSAPVSSLARIGVSNPALLAWELMPYSFVVDWFLPIGNWLGNLDATAGLQFHSGFTTTILKVEQVSSRLQGISRADGLASRDTHINESRYYTSMVRSAMNSFPSAPAPAFKNPISMSHMASAMALLKQFKR